MILVSVSTNQDELAVSSNLSPRSGRAGPIKLAYHGIVVRPSQYGNLCIAAAPNVEFKDYDRLFALFHRNLSHARIEWTMRLQARLAFRPNLRLQGGHPRQPLDVDSSRCPFRDARPGAAPWVSPEAS